MWWRYRDDIFDLWTQGTTKLDEFTAFINSLYPTIKFTIVSSEVSLNVLDLTLSLVNTFNETDIYSKPTDDHMYLLRGSAHPTHCTKAIPFGVATRIRINCSTDQKFEQRSKEYQNYRVSRPYLPHQVKKQFDKTKDIPRRDLLTPKTRDKEVIFPFVTDFNPHLPDINNIISNYSHLIYSSPTLSQIFPQGPLSHLLEGPKNIKELLAGPKGSNYTSNDTLPSGCFKWSSKCD